MLALNIESTNFFLFGKDVANHAQYKCMEMGEYDNKTCPPWFQNTSNVIGKLAAWIVLLQ